MTNAQTPPRLLFTRAELAFAMGTLLASLPDSDDSTRIDLVEIRHAVDVARRQGAFRTPPPGVHAPGSHPPPEPPSAPGHGEDDPSARRREESRKFAELLGEEKPAEPPPSPKPRRPVPWSAI